MSSENGRLLLVFAKEPAAGKVKTRLAASVGAERAAALAAAFLDDTLVHAFEAARQAGAGLEVHHSPPCAATAASFRVRTGRLRVETTLIPQLDAPSLGERLAHALEGATGRAVALPSSAPASQRRDGRPGPARGLVVIGTDSPHLHPDDYAGAFRALERSPAVLGPATDGGYWLVGVAPARGGDPSALLDPIRWSTPDALGDTRRAFARRGIAVSLLAEREDVDDAAGLERLTRRLLPEPHLAPHTARVLLA